MVTFDFLYTIFHDECSCNSDIFPFFQFLRRVLLTPLEPVVLSPSHPSDFEPVTYKFIFNSNTIEFSQYLLNVADLGFTSYSILIGSLKHTMETMYITQGRLDTTFLLLGRSQGLNEWRIT